MPVTTQRLARLARPVSRAVSAQAPRAFATSAAARKSATEAVKDGLKTVDRAVSDKVVVPGLDAAAKVKETAEKVTKGQAKGDVKGKARDLQGQAKGKAEELQGQAKGMAHEAAGKAKGAAEEVKKKM